jgi:filamentous hemagglutinin
MAYLGLQPNTPLLNTSTQTFSGNSVATQFTLARSVASASDLDVMIGSTLQRPFTDYIAGNVSLQFISAPTTGTNNITVTYRGGALNSLDLTVNTFNAGTVAAPGVVSLAANNTGIYWANASSMSVTVSGTNRATFLANATSISTDTGALVVDGGAGIDGNVNISGRVAIVDSTESTSISTGAFKVSGGAGIVGNLNIGGDITCVGDFTVNGTFTTTGTDSLAVTDPFIFLAENNPGDTYDSGVISQYYDGANLRYTGYFRDVTDAKYKLFTNLLTEPTTTVDTTDPSFQYTDLILANLSATGNVTGTYFVGNGAALTGISTSTSNIFNANTSVAIAAVNANVNIVVNGSQIANVWSGGISVVGAVAASTTLSSTGNIIGGNVQTAGIITATGNITSAGNISAGNLVTGGAVVASGNVTGGNVTGTTAISTTGSVVGGSLRTSGIVSAAGDVYGDNFIAATNIGASGNVTGGNIISSQDIFGIGEISTAGNITGSYFLGNGSQLTGIDATSIQNGNSNVRVVSAGGNVTVGVGGTSNVAVFSTGGVNVTGNVVGGNINTAGVVSGTANIIGANLVTAGNVFASAMIANTVNDTRISLGSTTGIIAISVNANSTQFGPSGAITLGGASQIIGGTFGGSGITLGTSQTDVFQNRGGNVTVQVGTGGTIASTWTFAQNGSFTSPNVLSAVGNVVAGNVNTAGIIAVSNTSGLAISAAGNVTGGNIITSGDVSAGGLVSTTGNVTGGNINTAGLITATGNVTSTANVAAGNILTANMVQGATLSATANVFATANVSGAYFLGTGVSLSGNVISGISTAANITGGNVISVAAMSAVSVSASGNINGGNLIVTGIVVDNIGNLELQSTATNGNVNLTPNGTGIVGISTSLSVTGNVTGAGHIGTMYTNSIINTGANLTGNIGSATTYFNTAFVKATSAQYADLAEWYEADADYSPGTVLVFGGDREVTQAIGINDVRVAGVVSTNPAHVMNSGLKAPHTAALALTGRVPTLVVGAVKKGDMMVTAGGGRAQACAEPRMGSVIGKALQDHPGGQGIIEIVVGRM